MILHLLGLFLIVNSCRIPEEVDVKGVLNHLNELDKIATRFGGNRASGTVGYDESVDYVLAQLEKTRLQVSLQSFSYSVVDIIGTPKLEQTAPSKTHFLYETDFNVIQNSKDGSVQATVTAVPNLGCEEGDFASFPKGNIALVKRGECPFAEKVKFAEEAGASAIIIYNNVAGLFLARVASKIPAFGMTHYVGLALSLETNVALSLTLVTKTTVTFTTNILAETPGGDPNKVIVVGSHLDGVTEGPGINDNGSGSANNLELALAVDKCLKAPVNKIRFGWWAAEELGLLGSHFYVNALSPQERRRIALNLNFDMLGSPNHFYGIYNGTSAPEPIRGLSTAIQKQFERYFAGSRQPFELTPFDGRSDYGPFIEIGIPAGGLFTGAEGVKTLKQRNTYGGLANAWYDPCYHSYCDDYGNIAPGPLKSNLEAAASTLEYFALLHLRAEDLPTGDRTTVLPYDTHAKAVVVI